MLQAECISSTMVKEMHMAHVSAVASWDTLLMTVGAKIWTVTTVEKRPCEAGMKKQKEQRQRLKDKK